MVAVFFSLVLLAGCGKAPEFRPLPPQTPVLVLGDSLAAGYGLPADQAWPALLSGLSGWRITNGGVSGDTTGQGLARIDHLLAEGEEPPRLVMIVLGGNDMLRRHPESEIRANLQEAVRRVRDAGAQPLLIAVPRPSLGGALLQDLEDAEFYAEIAASTRVPLIESAMSAVLSDPELKLDRLHPNSAGQRELAERFAQALRDLGLLAR